MSKIVQHRTALRARFETLNGTVVVHLQGFLGFEQVDIDTTQTITGQLEDLVNTGKKRIVADVSEAEYAFSKSANLLLRPFLNVLADDVRVAIVAAPGGESKSRRQLTRSQLELFGLGGVCSIVDDIDEGVLAVGGVPSSSALLSRAARRLESSTDPNAGA